MMVDINTANAVNSIMVLVVAYFLKRLIARMDDVDKISSDNRNDINLAKAEINLIKQEALLKHDHTHEKIDELGSSIKDLNSEIRHLAITITKNQK